MSLATGAVNFLMQAVDGGVSIFVGIPLFERGVFGGHFDKARAGLDQSTGQETTAPESAGVVFIVTFLFLQTQVERFTLLGPEKFVRILKRAQHRLLMVVAEKFALG